LDNPNVIKIVLGQSFAGNANATRKVDLDLNGNTLTGSASFTTAATGTITLGSGTLTGDLTVNTPNASFVNNATVDGTTTIVDAAPSTFTNNGSLQAVVINDANGIRFVNGIDATVGTVTIDALNGQVLLEGLIQSVVVAKPATLTVKGTISTLTANADVTVQGNGTVETTSGSGEITVREDVTVEGAGSLVKALNELMGKGITTTETEYGHQFYVNSSADSSYDISMGYQDSMFGDGLWGGEVIGISGSTANFTYFHEYDDTNTEFSDGEISLENGSLAISYTDKKGTTVKLFFNLQTGYIIDRN
jgi:hypothetical protein